MRTILLALQGARAMGSAGRVFPAPLSESAAPATLPIAPDDLQTPLTAYATPKAIVFTAPKPVRLVPGLHLLTWGMRVPVRLYGALVGRMGLRRCRIVLDDHRTPLTACAWPKAVTLQCPSL